MEYINKNLKLKKWEFLVKEHGLYKGAIDSDVLVDYGLYEYTRTHIDMLTKTDSHDDYNIYLGCMFYIIPKTFFVEVDNG